MNRGFAGVPQPSSWHIDPEERALALRLQQRRWRIMRAALPVGCKMEPSPPWVRTPEQFVAWQLEQLPTAIYLSYLRDLERIAKQVCDLEILRIARKYARYLLEQFTREAEAGLASKLRRPRPA